MGNHVTAKAQVQNFGEFKDLIIWDIDIHGANPRENSNEITFNILVPNLESKETFWTDSNGLKMIRRKLNHRDSYQIYSP
jgi:hypothetical protein